MGWPQRFNGIFGLRRTTVRSNSRNIGSDDAISREMIEYSVTYDARPPKKALRQNRLLHLVTRIRVQLGLGYLFCCVLPAFWINPGLILDATTNNSFYAVSAAFIVGYYFLRGLTQYPGIQSVAFIFPTFAATYGLASIYFFLFRQPYSAALFLLSNMLCAVWFHIVFFIVTRRQKSRLALLPFGNVQKLANFEGNATRVLSRPTQGFAEFDAIVADLRQDIPAEWQSYLTEAAISGKPVYHVRQITESLSGRVEIDHLSESTLGSLLPNFAFWRLKRTIDFLGAIIALPLLLPLAALIAIIIKLDSRGPIFFRQDRMGYQGNTFRIWKFRTMFDETSAKAKKFGTRTQSNDPRITGVGKFLRRTRIDELPQVLNILSGDMSWIGPRPEAIELSRHYETVLPFYRYRHIVRPGITGWAQVNQGHVFEDDDVLNKLHYDFYYIKELAPIV